MFVVFEDFLDLVGSVHDPSGSKTGIKEGSVLNISVHPGSGNEYPPLIFVLRSRYCELT